MEVCALRCGLRTVKCQEFKFGTVQYESLLVHHMLTIKKNPPAGQKPRFGSAAAPRPASLSSQLPSPKAPITSTIHYISPCLFRALPCSFNKAAEKQTAGRASAHSVAFVRTTYLVGPLGSGGRRGLRGSVNQSKMHLFVLYMHYQCI